MEGLERLEGTLDSDVVDGRVGKDVGFGRCCWKAWKGRRQLEGLEGTPDSDVVARRFGRGVVNWKGLEETVIERVERRLEETVIGRIIDWKRL